VLWGSDGYFAGTVTDSFVNVNPRKPRQLPHRHITIEYDVGVTATH
jgi:hypothetical protein